MTGRKQPIRPSGFSPDNLSPEVLQGIGEVVACWSYVEFQLSVLIREALNISRTAGLVLMADMRIHPLCEAARAIANDPKCNGDAQIRADILDLAKAIDGRAQSRHDYAHGVFGFLMQEGANSLSRYITKKPHERIEPRREPVTVKNLKTIADEAYNLGVRAQDLTVRVKLWKRAAARTRPR